MIAWLVVAPLLRRDVPVFPLDTPDPAASEARVLAAGTLTVDARDAHAWAFVDLSRGTVLSLPDTAGWDLAVRRFHVITHGDAADLGRVPFDSVAVAPADGFRPTVWAADTVNAAIDRWYRYSIFSHVLQPDGRVWALRTHDGRYAKVTPLSYYCPGLVAGCFTLRYAYQPDGSRTLR